MTDHEHGPLRTRSPAGLLAGVDVGTWQAGIDFARARAAGYGFAVVRAGGSHLADRPYPGPHYRVQVSGARTAGLRVGHCWLVGDYQSPTQAADRFVDRLHDYRRGDVVALHNAVFHGSAELWDDVDVAAFFGRVRGRVGAHVPWLHLDVADLRAGSWHRTVTAGTKLWVASRGADDGRSAAPDLDGACPEWSVHQYTPVGTVGGMHPVALNAARPDAFEVVDGAAR